MLRVTNIDATEFNPNSKIVVEGVESHLVTLNFIVIANTKVNCTIIWNDRNEVDNFGMQLSPLTVNASKVFGVGSYVIKIICCDNVYPVQNKKEFFVNVSVTGNKNISIRKVDYVSGPILPKDSGNPSAEQWLFHGSSNLDVLASSVKSVLRTSVGERVMEPEFGTELTKYIFDPVISSVSSVILEEIVSALSRWEPRVSVVGIDAKRENNNRSILFSLDLVSKLDGSKFKTSISVSN